MIATRDAEAGKSYIRGELPDSWEVIGTVSIGFSIGALIQTKSGYAMYNEHGVTPLDKLTVSAMLACLDDDDYWFKIAADICRPCGF